MVGRQAGQSGDFGVHLGVLTDERVAGGDGFDLGVGEDDFGVEVLDGANGVGGVERGGDLGDEPCLAFHRAPCHMYGSKLPVVT